MPTTDQKNLQSDFLPTLINVIGTDTEESKQMAMVMNRSCVAGIDPFLLGQLCPDDFARACYILSLTVDEGYDAILLAHQRGPGALLFNGTGIPDTATNLTDIDALTGDFWSHRELREEALWVLMADCTSSQVEGESHDFLFRMRETVQACVSFHRMVESLSKAYILDEVIPIIRNMTQNLTYVDMGDKAIPNVPVTDQDVGFFLLYKAGNRCCGVKSNKPGSPTFYGVNAGCGTLADYGVKCDKYLSEQFGLVYNPVTGV